MKYSHEKLLTEQVLRGQSAGKLQERRLLPKDEAVMVSCASWSKTGKFLSFLKSQFPIELLIPSPGMTWLAFVVIFRCLRLLSRVPEGNRETVHAKPAHVPGTVRRGFITLAVIFIVFITAGTT